MGQGSKLSLISVVILLVIIGFSRMTRAEARTELFSGASTSANHPRILFSVDSSVRSLSEAFAKAGYPYHPEDHITVFPAPEIAIGSVIIDDQAMPTNFIDGKKKYVLYTWAETVGGLLDEKKIELGAEDKVSPTLLTKLVPGMTVTINRVARTTVTETEIIPFESKEKENATMWRGEKKIIQQGVNGSREKKYLVIREDGELKSKTLTSNVIVKQTIAKITEIGTKLKIGETYFGKATYYENNLGTKVATDKFKRGTALRVTNMNNGKSIFVTNDGCICGATGVLVDLNPAYFQQLGGTLGQGVLQNVRLEEILN